MFGASDSKSKRINVRLELIDGEYLTGNIDVPGTSTFASAVNNADGFLSFRPMNGSPSYIAKTAIRRIEQVDVPEADQISRRSLDAGDNFDPYAALGVEKDAGQGTVRSAYLKLVMQYHPDKYSGVDLPKEVERYMQVMHELKALGQTDFAMSWEFSRCTLNE